jgi:hypothetical protein
MKKILVGFLILGSSAFCNNLMIDYELHEKFNNIKDGQQILSLAKKSGCFIIKEDKTTYIKKYETFNFLIPKKAMSEDFIKDLNKLTKSDIETKWTYNKINQIFWIKTTKNIFNKVVFKIGKLKLSSIQ